MNTLFNKAMATMATAGNSSLKVGDKVRINDADHSYTGCEGFVIELTANMFNRPLYIVKTVDGRKLCFYASELNKL